MTAAVRITFVGNEGVLAEGDGGAVLIDALFGDGAAAYTTTPRAVVDAVETARPPFDAADGVLSTHFHPDHFNPYSVARYLQHNPKAWALSTPQSRDLLAAKAPAFAALSGRVYAVAPKEGERTSSRFGGVVVDAFGLSHGRVNYGDVEHLGFIVRLGAATVIHLGDGIIAERSLDAAGVFEESFDAAFLPFWFLTYPAGRRLYDRRLRGIMRRTFAIHIPPGDQKRLVEEVAATDPEAVALTSPMWRTTVPA